MIRTAFYVILLLFCIVHCFAEDLESMINYREIKSMSGQQLYEHLRTWGNFDIPEQVDVIQKYTNPVNDTLSAPFLFYIPPDYDPLQTTPLLVYLHGLVSVPDFIKEDFEYVSDSYFLPFCKENNWFMLFPAGNQV